MRHKISHLSLRARLKGRLLYYGSLLHIPYSIFISLNKKDPATVHWLLFAFSLFVLFRLRPGNIQNVLDEYTKRQIFPFKWGNVNFLRFLLALGFIFQIIYFFVWPDFALQTAARALFMLPTLIFLFDKELAAFVFVDSKAQSEGPAVRFIYNLSKVLFGLFICLTITLLLMKYVFPKKVMHLPVPEITSRPEPLDPKPIRIFCKLANNWNQETGFEYGGNDITDRQCKEYCERLRGSFVKDRKNLDRNKCFLQGKIVYTF